MVGFGDGQALRVLITKNHLLDYGKLLMQGPLQKYVAGNTISMWHPSSTVAMGAAGDSLTCLDTDFKVKGVEGLRVVDCSAIPLMIRYYFYASQKPIFS